MQAQIEQKSPFAAAFSLLQGARRDPAWVAEIRQKAFAAFSASGLPTRRDEAWKYTSLRPVSDVNFGIAPQVSDLTTVQAAISGSLIPGAINLVFINGHLAANLSTKFEEDGLLVSTLTDAVQSRAELVRPHLEKSAKSGEAFTLLNAAFFADGIVIDVTPRATIARKVHLLHVNTAESNLGKVAVRHFVNVGEGAELNLIESHISLDPTTKSLTNSVLDGKLQKGAKLKLARLELQGEAALHIGSGHIELHGNSLLESFCYSAGARLNRYDLQVVLAGEGAETELNGLYLTRSGQLVDHHTTIHHLVPNAISRQLYKGILDGESRAVFNGKVVVNREAQGTSAKQLNRNLLLSPNSEIDTKPELLIDADDVKCAHGASIGQLDDDQIFYLRSRGLGLTEARRLLSVAFADEVLLKAPHIREWLRPMTMGYFA